jgi:hypothetical protein
LQAREDEIGPHRDQVSVHTLCRPGDIGGSKVIHPIRLVRIALAAIDIRVRRSMDYGVWPQVIDRLRHSVRIADVDLNVYAGTGTGAEANHPKPSATARGKQVATELST